MMNQDDNKTTTTSDFLDLIQEDAIATPSLNNSALSNRKCYSDTESRSHYTNHHNREASLFRVRLSHNTNEKHYLIEEEDYSSVHCTEVRKKMPLNGGYGGMFETSTKKKTTLDQEDGNATVASDVSSKSSISAALSMASKWISGKFTKRDPKIRHGSIKKRPPSELFKSLPSWCIRLSVTWLRLPFQFRYFVQLFCIVAVFLLASLNYFIAVQSPRGEAAVGGGGSMDKIPSMQLKKPLQYLHHVNGGELLAAGKLKHGGIVEGGPFAYGWKSMPRQIFVDDLTSQQETSDNNDNEETENIKVFPPKGIAAYVLPITSCYNPTSNSNIDNEILQNFYPDTPNSPTTNLSFRDYALMLRSTIHAHSYRNPASGSMWDYKMVALVHPNARKCTDEHGTVDRVEMLQELGYEVSIVRPLRTNGVGSEYLRDYYESNGGEDMEHLSDFIRLNAYELEEYDAVVLVDYDTLILGSVDEALDLINESEAVFSWKHVRSVREQYRASVINLSFFILKPSKETFGRIRQAINEALFIENKGWGRIGRGRFPGWMTTQGFLTYYYDEVDNASKVEMNRCAFGNTGESLFKKYNSETTVELITNAGKVDCQMEQTIWVNQCMDCSKSDIQDVLVADLSYCIAPWKCGVGDGKTLASSSETLSSSLCRKFQKGWYGARLQMEDVHPQLEKGEGSICVGGEYQPMKRAVHNG